MENENKRKHDEKESGGDTGSCTGIQKKALEKILELKKSRPKLLTNTEIGPAQYHHWGILNNIKNHSPTLKKLVDAGGVVGVTDYKGTFHTILAELGLEFTIEKLPTPTEKKGVMYDIHSIPRWSFGDFAQTEEQAIRNAAKQGLEFFVFMS